VSPEVERLARVLWAYHHLNHELRPSDAILVQGSHDLRVAERGAALFLEGLGAARLHRQPHPRLSRGKNLPDRGWPRGIAGTPSRSGSSEALFVPSRQKLSAIPRLGRAERFSNEP
jgi:hypothetical protein